VTELKNNQQKFRNGWRGWNFCTL